MGIVGVSHKGGMERVAGHDNRGLGEAWSGGVGYVRDGRTEEQILPKWLKVWHARPIIRVVKERL